MRHSRRVQVHQLTVYSELLADPTSKELQPADRPLASLLVSKIYYYLGVMDEAVNFALKGYAAFTQEPEGEYTETIVGESLCHGECWMSSTRVAVTVLRPSLPLSHTDD